MPKNVQSKAVLITGGAVRIGRAIGELFSRSGYSVIIHYYSSGTEAGVLAKDIIKSGGNAWTVKGRLDTETGCRKVMSEAWRVSGGFSVLVNNASQFEVAAAAESSWALFSRMFELNLFAPARLSRDFLKRLSRRKGMNGSIINLLDCRISGTDSESAAYTLSKKALADYTRMTALEFAPGVRVNGVAPGAVLPAKGKGVKKHKGKFKDNPLKKRVKPEDVAAAALYMAESPLTTGQILFVDGGKHLEE